jgi:hypothetical protein
MKRIIYTLLLFTVPALANYCIQAVTLDRFNPDHMSSRLSNILDNFQDARVEERGSYLVLRVGDFNSYSQALTNINSVKDYYSDAYIRKCDFDIARVIYPNYSVNTRKTSLTQQQNDRVLIRKPKKRVVKEQKYEQPQPQNTSYSDTLWQDCQKCFAPIYLEEEESEPKDEITQHVEVKQVEKPKVTTKKEYKSTPKTDNDFWVEAVDEKEKPLDKKSEEFYDSKYYPEIDSNHY